MKEARFTRFVVAENGPYLRTIREFATREEAMAHFEALKVEWRDEPDMTLAVFETTHSEGPGLSPTQLHQGRAHFEDYLLDRLPKLVNAAPVKWSSERNFDGLGLPVEEHTVRRQARADAATTVARMGLNNLEDNDCGAAFSKLLHMKELMGSARTEWASMGGQGPMPVDSESPVRVLPEAFRQKCLIQKKGR